MAKKYNPSNVGIFMEILPPDMEFPAIAEALYIDDMANWMSGGCKGSPPSKISPGGCQKLVQRSLARIEKLYIEAGMRDWL